MEDKYDFESEIYMQPKLPIPVQSLHSISQ
jgi:hypothetical protein